MERLLISGSSVRARQGALKKTATNTYKYRPFVAIMVLMLIAGQVSNYLGCPLGCPLNVLPVSSRDGFADQPITKFKLQILPSWN